VPCAIIIAANLLAISKSVSHKMYHEKKNYVTKYFKLFKILSTLKVPSLVSLQDEDTGTFKKYPKILSFKIVSGIFKIKIATLKMHYCLRILSL